jgi:hypothetical protein
MKCPIVKCQAILESPFRALEWVKNQNVEKGNPEKSALNSQLLKNIIFFEFEYTIGIHMPKLVGVGHIKLQK